jgi:hypothetical protein
MNTSQTTSRIAIAVAGLAAFVALSAPAQAAPAKPAAMSTAEYRAVVMRSEQLNRQYGNAVTRLTRHQFKALYDAGAHRLAPQELVALVTRSVALNRLYGLGASR